jgi:hypothetical protein
MTTVVTNATGLESCKHVKEYYFLLASRRFADDDQLITIATLQEWRSTGDVRGPLSRDEFIRLVREQLVVETTTVWEVWDGIRVWPHVQAEKLMLFREAYRPTISRANPPQSTAAPERTDDVSAGELVGSVLEEIRVELPLAKPSLLWRIPLVGWLLGLCGWKLRATPTAVMPADSIAASAIGSRVSAVSSAGNGAASATSSVTTDSQTAKSELDFELSSSASESASLGLAGIGGLSLDDLEDADPPTEIETTDFATPMLRRAVADLPQAPADAPDFGQPAELLPSGELQGAIANAVEYFDAKAVKTTTKLSKEGKTRVVDRLAILAYQIGQLCLKPFRGILAAAGKAIAAERVLVTGETFQRLDNAARRGLSHPLTWGAVTASGLLVFAFLFLQPRGPDELDLFAVRKLKEAHEAIRAVRQAKPDEQSWAEFSQLLTEQLNIVKQELQRELKVNRPIKEGLYLALEYRLPRILKEGRLKPSPVEGEFEARIRDAEHQIQLLSH